MRGLVAYVAQFDRTVRKLLPELQSGSQSLHENPIFGFRLSVDFDDVTCVRRVIGEFVLHENLTVRPTANSLKQSFRVPSPSFKHLGKFWVNAARRRLLKLKLSGCIPWRKQKFSTNSWGSVNLIFCAPHPRRPKMEEFKKLGVNCSIGRPLRLCANCSDAMIAATSLKYVSERCVRNSWSCDVCGFECETTVTLNDKRTTN